MKVTATGIYKERETHDVVVSNIRKDVSQRGIPMYVMDCEIILAKSEDETVVDKRVVYKAGETQMAEVRDALISYVAKKLAEESMPFSFTGWELLDTISPL